jgi:hypothetical protein
LAQGSKIPVLEVEAQVLAATETVTNVIYRDSARANVFQVGIAEQLSNNGSAVMYPNPCGDNANLIWNQQSPSRTTISITDLQGRVVASHDMGTLMPGTQTRTIDVSNLSSGVYIVRIQYNGLSGSSTYMVKQ